MRSNDVALELLLSGLILTAAFAHLAFKAQHRKQSINVGDMAAWFTCLFFGLGPWLAFTFGGYTLPPAPDGTIVLSYLSVAMFVVVLVLGSSFFERLFPIVDDYGNRTHKSHLMYSLELSSSIRPAKIFSLFIVAALAWLLTMVVFGSGVSDNLSRRDSYTLSSLFYIFQISLRGCYFWALFMLFAVRRSRTLAITIISYVFLVDFAVSRRDIVADAIILTIFLFVYRGLKVRVFITAVLLCVLLANVLLPVFQAARSIRPRYEREPVLNQLRYSIRDAMHEYGNAEYKENYEKNMATRPMIIRYNMIVVDGLSRSHPLYGQAFLSDLMWTLPGVLYPEKYELPSSEELVTAQLGLYRTDYSTSWSSLAMADFGLMGPAIYGLIYVLIIGMTQLIARGLSTRYPTAALIIVAAITMVSTNAESTTTALLIEARTSLMVALPLFILSPFVRPRFPESGLAEPSHEFLEPY